MTKTPLQNQVEYQQVDWRTSLYHSMHSKRQEIDGKSKEILGSENSDGINILEKKLKTASQNGDHDKEIGYLVLGLAHLYAKEGSYDEALGLLSKHKDDAINAASINNTSGLLYISLLHSAILKKLDERQKDGSAKSTSTMWEDPYHSHVKDHYLTPDMEELMTG